MACSKFHTLLIWNSLPPFPWGLGVGRSSLQALSSIMWKNGDATGPAWQSLPRQRGGCQEHLLKPLQYANLCYNKLVRICFRRKSLRVVFAWKRHPAAISISKSSHDWGLTSCHLWVKLLITSQGSSCSYSSCAPWINTAIIQFPSSYTMGHYFIFLSLVIKWY